MFFDFTLCFISCDDYFVERHSCNINAMSFAWLYVIFQLHGFQIKMVAWFFSFWKPLVKFVA